MRPLEGEQPGRPGADQLAGPGGRALGRYVELQVEEHQPQGSAPDAAWQAAQEFQVRSTPVARSERRNGPASCTTAQT